MALALMAGSFLWTIIFLWLMDKYKANHPKYPKYRPCVCGHGVNEHIGWEPVINCTISGCSCVMYYEATETNGKTL